MDREKQLIVVRGGGDIATGTIHRLCRCGYPVLILETEHPSAIRRKVAFSEAVYDGRAQVEDITCFYAEDFGQAQRIMKQGCPAIMIDEECRILSEITPWALIDGILAKKNLGTHRGMADKTIALGPGFRAGVDVDLVIETMRGHNLGRIIQEGAAMQNTGVPGMVGGFAKERVIYAPAAGRVHIRKDIGERVQQGEEIAWIEGAETQVSVKASISGLLRGMIRADFPITKGVKMADIDAREAEYENCFTISDKARCIAGSVLEGLLYLEACQKR